MKVKRDSTKSLKLASKIMPMLVWFSGLVGLIMGTLFILQRDLVSLFLIVVLMFLLIIYAEIMLEIRHGRK